MHTVLFLEMKKSIPRSSIADVYKSIQDDLIYASQKFIRIPAQKGRATSGAALVLLGKPIYMIKVMT
jgi:hypothetical protein